MKDKGIQREMAKDFDTSDRRTQHAFYGFRKMFWDYLNKLHVVFSDPCCETATGDDKDPVGWDESQGQFVRWDGTAWVAITAFTTTTTTTSTTTTSTTTTTTAAPTTTTTTTAPSDMRLKTNIQPTGRMVTVSVPEYTWEWNDEAKSLGLGHYPTIGVMAQELLEVAPHLVSVGEDGYYRVNYSGLNYN